MTRNQARDDTWEFIAMMMLCDDVLPVPITWEDAAYDMSNWAAEDIPLPAGMTPELFAEVWNEMIMEEKNNG
jgi:hypothetical protein